MERRVLVFNRIIVKGSMCFSLGAFLMEDWRGFIGWVEMRVSKQGRMMILGVNGWIDGWMARLSCERGTG